MRNIFSAIVVLLALATDASADQIEFRTGAKLEGRIVARDDKQVKIETTVGGRTYTRTVPLDRLSAIVIGDQREMLNETAGDAPAKNSPSATSSTATREIRSRQCRAAHQDADRRADPARGRYAAGLVGLDTAGVSQVARPVLSGARARWLGQPEECWPVPVGRHQSERWQVALGGSIHVSPARGEQG